MTCDPGDLVLLAYPYADLSTTKKRPVLVLSRPDAHGDFIGLAVTSVPQPEPHLAIAADGLSDGELPKPSWIRVDKVFHCPTRLWLSPGSHAPAWEQVATLQRRVRARAAGAAALHSHAGAWER
jgi:hypothetical protein